MMTYELWETQTGNAVASYENEDQALAAVASFARKHGPESVQSLALVRIGEVVEDENGDEDAELETIASGVELLARATSMAPGETSPLRKTG